MIKKRAIFFNIFIFVLLVFLQSVIFHTFVGAV